ncbi:MAG: hypothetical protein P8N11_10275, partial [Gammaproteobacteria bacterium]|nr:hypothetical protein [Gammaproteobacteria bacterium]
DWNDTVFRASGMARTRVSRHVLLVSILALDLFSVSAFAQFTNEDAPPILAQQLGAAQTNLTSWEYSIGDFRVSWQGNNSRDAQLVISSLAQPQEPYWQSLPGSGFVLAAIASRVTYAKSSFQTV